ncbi:MAG: hypothetical protein CGU29_15275 [Candidatus Dactylopiibacterium carminicum]|uniref:Uncharacterized protein n=1 Tax=Candidatus Dactylopiibacterium carminicum TaxID=857335 RepID=A0A272ENF9_9RHOO|nr:hypothetical protein [Candidatus Dactylopiibacterium carminicum]KAF7599262.1 hypothetical protein BGI27_08730 [Candidatus Dactylopiibacterium carminicum]PAS91655.1 MAG: hypothetical protein CGU29_15275 [Candidatus Dactylopiibacterium carminicum]PAS99270.1 MAG: hypothetical protein BSR46_08765 [Candidatus Dactylopiibacterium carminicum]
MSTEIPLPSILRTVPADPGQGQTLALIEDSAGFVNRGLALLWRTELPVSDATQSQALQAIKLDRAGELAALLQESPALLHAVPGGCLLIETAAQ